jgi:CubicO group peptidase (beta-lactamase class C family)
MRRLMRDISALLLLAPAASFAASSHVADTGPAHRPLSMATLMDEALVPGLQMAVVTKGRIQSVRGVGSADADSDSPVTRETVFEAASLGKPVFAYGVLKLASSGRIDLDVPVSRYLPDLKGPAAQLTPRRLLSHTGGLPNGGGKLDVSSVDIGRFSYSGEGYGLLQRVVEAITHQPLDDYMRAEVFEPLEMKSSSYIWREEFKTTKSFGHGFTGANAGRTHIPVARAQSSLETTAADYARFMLAIVRGQGLDPAIAREALRPQVKLERGCLECLGKPKGELSDRMSWGLGWGLEQTDRGSFAWHWGDNNTMQSYAAIALDGSRGVVIFTNSSNGHSIMRSIASRKLGVDAPGYSLGVYAPYRDPARRLLARIVRRGPAAVTSSDLSLPRTELIQVAERLMQGGKPVEAAALLRRLPGELSIADLALLAEAERKAGNLEQARRYAEAALQREPSNSKAREAIERISMATRVVAPQILDLYTGRYRTPFGPLEVSRSGAGLAASLEDQPKSEMLAMSDNSFLIERMGVPIEFIRGSDGRVSHAVVQAGSPVILTRLEP